VCMFLFFPPFFFGRTPLQEQEGGKQSDSRARRVLRQAPGWTHKSRVADRRLLEKLGVFYNSPVHLFS
jgi:hypothetical protein